MDASEIIRDFIVENFLFGETNHFTEYTDFFEKGILDSTGIIELVGFIEQTFNVCIEDDELIIDNFSSLDHITRYLQLKLTPKES